MFRYTIRFRLTLWFAGTLTIIMFASGFFWDRHLANLMMNNVDERLQQFSLEIENLQHQGGWSCREGEKPTACEQLKEFVHSYNWGIYVQQLTLAGEIVCTSQNLGDLHIPANWDVLAAANNNSTVFTTIKEFRGPRVRVLTYALRDRGLPVGYLQIGKDISHNDENLQSLRSTLLFYTPLLVLALGACGWLLATRALEPIERISAEVGKITAERLNERLPVDVKPNELSQLTASFNDMLERLADSFNRIRQFSADASHELRTPLAILKGETEVALRWSKDTDELRACLASNLEEIDRLERIIEDLLYLAKSESGEFRLFPTSFSLSDLLQDIYLIGNTLGEPKEITVSLHLNVAEEIFITADQMHLHRALLNLVSNAVKYTPDGGTVAVTLDISGRQACICVRDSGVGIPEHHLAHIFKRFYRVDEARNRSAGGTGLGLAIVKAIVTAHKGTVEVTSTVGVGSVFTIRLPLGELPAGDGD